MIFVTTGTSRYKFDRLIDWCIKYHREVLPQESMIIQTGSFDSSRLNNIEGVLAQKYFSFELFLKYIKKSRVVVSHAGMGTIMNCLMLSKKPVVVARDMSKGEHTNNHQYSGINYLRKKDLVIPVSDYSGLITKLKLSRDNFRIKYHNQGNFIDRLTLEIDKLFRS